MDLGLDGTRADRLEAFRQAMALGFDEFTFRLKAQTRSMDLADTVRVQVAVQYRTRAWQTVDVDLGPAGVGAVDLVHPAIRGLAEMGLPVTSPIRCLSLNDQLAQKLHACTGPHSQGRARDVLDILLIDLLGQVDLQASLVSPRIRQGVPQKLSSRSCPYPRASASRALLLFAVSTQPGPGDCF